MKIHRNLLKLVTMVAFSMSTLVATAQSYPNRLLNMVVPYPAGGPSDFVARTIQVELAKNLGQQIIVENVGGASGGMGIQKVIQAPADGYTLLLGTPMELILTPIGLEAVKHKPEDIKIAAIMSRTSLVLMGRKDLAANTVEELMALAKKSGAKELTYGSIGPGSLYHLAAESFSQKTGIKMLHVPYKGAAPLVTDLMGGQIDIVFMPYAGNIPSMIQEGKVKAFGLTTRIPNPSAPNLPTLANVKGLDGFEFDLWVGLGVAKNTSDANIETLNKAVYSVLKNVEIRKAFERTGKVSDPLSPAELSRIYLSEIQRYQAIAKAANVKAQ